MSRKIYCVNSNCRHCIDGLCVCYELVMQSIEVDIPLKEIGEFPFSVICASEQRRDGEII